MSDLIEQYRILHQDPKVFRGLSVLPYAGEIKKLCAETGAKTLLDFGAGKAQQYQPPYEVQKWWGVEVRAFDPAVPGLSKKPDSSLRFDGVLCIDVLEHLEANRIQGVIEQLFTYGTKFVFLTACLRAANRKLPDGRNAHLTVQPLDWWSGLIKDRRIVMKTEERGLKVEFRPTT